MSEVNDYQVGGDHYRSKIQHWDYVEINGLGYLEGCASKYATRNRKKHNYPEIFVKIAALFGVTMPDPIEDLTKAIHYCKKLQSLHLAGQRNNRRGPVVIPAEEFIAANELNDKEARVIMILTFWNDAGDLEDAIEIIEDMRDSAQAVLDNGEEHF